MCISCINLIWELKFENSSLHNNAIWNTFDGLFIKFLVKLKSSDSGKHEKYHLIFENNKKVLNVERYFSFQMQCNT